MFLVDEYLMIKDLNQSQLSCSAERNYSYCLAVFSFKNSTLCIEDCCLDMQWSFILVHLHSSVVNVRKIKFQNNISLCCTKRDFDQLPSFWVKKCTAFLLSAGDSILRENLSLTASASLFRCYWLMMVRDYVRFFELWWSWMPTYGRRYIVSLYCACACACIFDCPWLHPQKVILCYWLYMQHVSMGFIWKQTSVLVIDHGAYLCG